MSPAKEKLEYSQEEVLSADAQVVIHIREAEPEMIEILESDKLLFCHKKAQKAQTDSPATCEPEAVSQECGRSGRCVVIGTRRSDRRHL